MKYIIFTLLKLKQCNKIKRQVNFSLFNNEDNFHQDECIILSKIKPKGLRNLGGCCYMNATLQCFYHIQEFTIYFLKNQKEIIKRECFLSTGLLDVIKGLSKNDYFSYYEPQLFKNNLIEIDDIFEGGEGKDSGDLVRTILTTCQEELGGESDLPDFSIDQRDEAQMFLDLYFKNLKVQSIIIELFNFYARIKSTCSECKVDSYNILSENNIIFDLEQVYKLSKSGENKSSEISVSIDDCLNCYSYDGSLRENSLCNYCKKTSSLFSIRTFITLPKYLIMIMSRGENEKFECKVNFDEKINLKSIYNKMKGIPEENNTEYNLLGGTILLGSKGYGHTVAFCKHFDDEYYIFNDSSFDKASFDKIKNKKIYLLFYKKND